MAGRLCARSCPRSPRRSGRTSSCQQHGADSHAWDPLAHLLVTTTAMGEAARLVDALAHRFAGGRWLSTGGGGYDAYRVVPRSWSLVWLAGAHRDAAGRDAGRVAGALGGRGAAVRTRRQCPTAFDDPPNAGLRASARAGAGRGAVGRRPPCSVRQIVVPRLLREAVAQRLVVAPGARAAIGDAGSTAGAARRTTVRSAASRPWRAGADDPRCPGHSTGRCGRWTRAAGQGGGGGARVVARRGRVADRRRRGRCGRRAPHPSDVIPPGSCSALGVAPGLPPQGLGDGAAAAAVGAAEGDPVIATAGVAERDPDRAAARRNPHGHRPHGSFEQAGFRVRPPRRRRPDGFGRASSLATAEFRRPRGAGDQSGGPGISCQSAR